MRAFLLLLLVPLIVAQNCTEYCANITEVCTGTNQQFESQAFCEASCWGYPNLANMTGATSGDSFQCRIYHLGVANTSVANMAIHCPHAGFNGGDGTCGTACEAYCDSMLFACPGVFPYPADNRTNCLQQCAMYPKLHTNPANNATQPTENTYECRAWHVIFGLSTNTTTVHCPHASPNGGPAPNGGPGVCGSVCDNYCDNDLQTCTGDLTQWANRSQCMLACLSWPEGNTSNTGSTYACRKYHATVANTTSSNAGIHCVHTGPLGGYGVCGSACDGYCNILGKACGGSNTQCMMDCANYTQTSTVMTKDLWKSDENSLECRTAYAVEALADASMCNEAMHGGPRCASSGSFASSVQVGWALVALLAIATSLFVAV